MRGYDIRLTLVILFSLFTVAVFAQDKLTRQQYIQKYKTIAIEQMDIYGVPASIKLAQGLLESDNGNGRLAREGRNHFGIKCKAEWQGETISHDDDAPQECFRVYATVEESYKDHSEFLDKSPRYQELFKLDPLDYKSWATGLKSAGYATNPAYAELLIKIIEDNQLYMFDEGRELPPLMVDNNESEPEIAESVPDDKREIIDVDNFVISIEGSVGHHTTYKNNGSQFLISKDGDTFASLAAEYNITTKKLLSFNDLSSEATLAPGEMVYIKKKSKRSENGKLIHIAKDGETLHSISQLYGIRLSNLSSINRRPKDSVLRSGQQIRLM